MYITYAELKAFYFKTNTNSIIFNKVTEYIKPINHKRRVRKLNIELVMAYIYTTKNKLNASGIQDIELEGVAVDHVFYYPKNLQNYNYAYITPEIRFIFRTQGVYFYLSLTSLRYKEETSLSLTPKSRNAIIRKFLKNF